MNTVNIPGFTAEASLGATIGVYRRKADSGIAVRGIQHSPIAPQALRGSIGDVVRTLQPGRGTMGFVCQPGTCTCIGVDDCLDLIVTTDLCGPSIDCIDFGGSVVCSCTRK
jgi:hypothetical protein